MKAKYLLVGSLLIGIFFFMYPYLFMKESKGVQGNVTEKYMNEEGLIHAYSYQPNSQYLSESLGLYMQYLLLMKDQQGFNEQYTSLVNHFIVEKGEERYIRWVLYEDTAVNALIDDVRIIDALFQASRLFHEDEYQLLAEQLSNTIRTRQIAAGLYTDFYDWSFEVPSSRITLSYLTPEFFHYFPSAERNKELLMQVKGEPIFFPEYFDQQKNQWISVEEAHMVDQLLIALNKENIGADSDFKDWIIAEWKEKKVIKGRYDKKLLKPTVSHESLAVYHYLFKYFIAINERKLASEVFERAKEIASVSVETDERHFFDFIQYELMRVEEKDKAVF